MGVAGGVVDGVAGGVVRGGGSESIRVDVDVEVKCVGCVDGPFFSFSFCFRHQGEVLFYVGPVSCFLFLFHFSLPRHQWIQSN